MNTNFNRRQLMHAASLGGSAALLAPFLSRLLAQASGCERAVAQPRIVFVVQSNGINPSHVTPAPLELKRKGGDPPGGSEFTNVSLSDQQLPGPIAGLAPFQDRLTILMNLSGRVAVSDHSANLGALGCYPGNSPHAETIDWALGQAMPSTFGHVALGYHNGDAMCYNFCASGPGKRVPILGRPDLAYRTLFGIVAQGADREAFDQKTHLLDFMASEVRRARSELVGEEREKFDRYLESFDALHRRQRELQSKSEEIRRHAPRIVQKLEHMSANLEQQFEIAAAALLGGLTNVVTLVSGGGGQQFGNYPEFGIPDLHHIGHGGSYGEKTAEECFIEIRQFHVKLITRLAEKLASVKEGDGTILDNTLIVYLSDSGEAHHPNLREWPVILLGNLGGKLATKGRFLRYPAYKEQGHRTLANLYLTLLHAIGKPRDTFGVPDLALKHLDQSGPLTELLA